MRRLIVLAIVILVMPAPALADEFNVNTGPPANTGVAGGDCQGIYNAAMEKLSEQELADEGEERKEIVDCNHEQPCVDAAIKKFAAAHNVVLKGQADAAANQNICNNGVNLAKSLAFDASRSDPCQGQYDQTMKGLSDQEVMAEDQEQKDYIDCNAQQNDSTGCRDAALQKYAAAHNKVLNGETDADTARSICVDRKNLAQSQSGNQPPSNPGVAQTPQSAPSAATGGTGSSSNSAPSNAPNNVGGGSSGSPGSPGNPLKGSVSAGGPAATGGGPNSSGSTGGGSSGGGGSPGRPGSPGNPLKGYASAGGPGVTAGGSNSTGSVGNGFSGGAGGVGRPGSPGNPLKGYASSGGGSNYAGTGGNSSIAGAGASGINGGIPGRMMALAAQMDKVATQIQNNAMAASNEFLKGMADAMGRTARVYAQKPGTVLPQMIKGIVKYLNDDHNKNDQALYDAAVKAVDEFQKNPARFFDEHALDVAMMGAGAAGEAATGARGAAAAGEIGTSAEAAQTAGELERAENHAARRGKRR